MRKRKQQAHRLERQRVKQAIRQGKEYVPKPLLTDWDIIALSTNIDPVEGKP